MTKNSTSSQGQHVDLKDVIHLYLGCKVQYEGILNGSELSAELKEHKSDVFYIPQIAHVRGLKIGLLKKIEITIDGKKTYRIGRKGLQTHYTCQKFKPILRPLSDMTQDEYFEWQALCSWLEYNNQKHYGNYSPKVFHWMLSKAFDLFGLIESGQAIDATTLIPKTK